MVARAGEEEKARVRRRAASAAPSSPSKKISESSESGEWSESDSVKLVQMGIRIGNGAGLEIRGKVVSWMRF